MGGDNVVVDYLQFGASLVGSLAWPVVVASAGGVVWRATPTEVRAEVVARLRKVGPGGFEADPAENDKAETDLEEAAGQVATPITAESLEKTTLEVGPRTSPADGENAHSWRSTTDTTGITDEATATVTRADPGTGDNRGQIDQLIRAAARWGWLHAGGDPEDFIPPLIGWTEHGPTIIRKVIRVNQADTVTFGAGSFIDAHTGKPNSKAYTSVNHSTEEAPIGEPDKGH